MHMEEYKQNDTLWTERLTIFYVPYDRRFVRPSPAIPRSVQYSPISTILLARRE